MGTDLLTTKQAAELLGVGTTSVKRWADSGTLRCVKTPGGHRRFPREAIGEFLRASDIAPDAADDRASQWVRVLVSGNDPNEVYKRLAAERAAAESWFHFADGLGPVLEEIGRRWETGALTVLQEHVASERLARGLARCAADIRVPAGAPVCLLAVVPGDDHTLGLSLLEPCVREAGWAARWAGRRTPTGLVREVIATGEVQMVAISASVYSTDELAMEQLIESLGPACRERGAALVFGGSGRWPAIPRYGARLHAFAPLRAKLLAR